MTNEQKAELNRLQKLTVSKLREEVKEKHKDDIKGVSGMPKEQIIEALCKLKGIPYEEDKHKVAKAENKTQMKKSIKTLKKDLSEKSGKKERSFLRNKVKRLKRALRRAA